MEDLELTSNRSPRCWACFLTCVLINADSYFDSRRIPHNLEKPQSQHKIQKSTETCRNAEETYSSSRSSAGNLHCSASRSLISPSSSQPLLASGREAEDPNTWHGIWSELFRLSSNGSKDAPDYQYKIVQVLVAGSQLKECKEELLQHPNRTNRT